MAIGERIHFFRTMRGMTQKYLGMALGFPEKSADVRLAQYENGRLYRTMPVPCRCRVYSFIRFQEGIFQ